MRVLAAALATGLVVQLAGACVSRRLAQEELPEQPIAFLHWEDKAAQKRSEIFAKAGEAPPVPPDPVDPERTEEFRIRTYLRGDETLATKGQLAKHSGRLMLIWPRTGRTERVEAAPRDALPIAWSPDRRRLLFASSHRGGKEQLYEYHLDRRDLTPITTGAAEHPRGDYVIGRDVARGELVVQQIERVQSVGRSANTVHRIASGGRIGPPLLSDVPPGTLRFVPDGDRVIYEHVRSRPRRNGPAVLESTIAIRALAKGAAPQLLLRGREPVLTPDGQWIVFASPSSAGYRLRRMRLDGTTRVAIGSFSPAGDDERMPAVSPDGHFVAFVQSRSGRRRLAVRRYDGKDERVLVSSGWSEFPVW